MLITIQSISIFIQETLKICQTGYQAYFWNEHKILNNIDDWRIFNGLPLKQFNNDSLYISLVERFLQKFPTMFS
jgi:hypothetical protein